MAKQESIDFRLLFGASTIQESLNADVPVFDVRPEAQLPTDDPLFLDSVPSTFGKAAQVEDEAFVDELIGSREDEAMKGRIPIQPALPVSTSSALTDIVKRSTRVLAQRPRHQRAIREITNRVRNSELFRPLKDDPVWDRLTENATNFVVRSILEAGA
jgi:hypothetical protein